jgi:hypothetical protein
MLIPWPAARVFAYAKSTDMRKSFSGLVGIVETELGQQVEDGGMFLFFNRRRNAVKVLFFTGDGLAIFYPAAGAWHVRAASSHRGQPRCSRRRNQAERPGAHSRRNRIGECQASQTLAPTGGIGLIPSVCEKNHSCPVKYFQRIFR